MYYHRKTTHQEEWRKYEGCNCTTVYHIGKQYEVHFCPSDRPVKHYTAECEESTAEAFESALAKAKAAGVRGSKLEPIK